jgi:integrase
MGSVISRGTRDNPRHFIKYREADGTQRMRLSNQPTKSKAKELLVLVEARIARGEPAFPEEDKRDPHASELLDEFSASLTNRNADDDKSRLERHLKPRFARMRISEIDLAAVMKWIDEMKAGKARVFDREKDRRVRAKLSGASMRQNVNLLSRFFSWAVERGYASVNPVRLIPQGKRPTQAQKRDQPWLEDDAIVRKLFGKLREPVHLMFYLGNRSGLRLGELCGLRISDLAFLEKGVVRVRYQYDGEFLKEDKRSEGKIKWVPAPADADVVLADWLTARETAGAGPEDLLFANPHRGGRSYQKLFIERAWEEAITALNEEAKKENPKAQDLDLTFYQATRHSFVSRTLFKGASLEEVSAAVGHSSPEVTKRYYDHFVRQSFSPGLREGLGITPSKDSAKVVQMGARRRSKG